MADAQHPNCVLVAPDLGSAAALAEWLTGKGFPAEAVPPSVVASQGDSLGFSAETFAGVEIRVAKSEHVEPARQTIAEHKDALAELRDKQEKRATRTGTTTAVCDECGKSSEWPAALMGTTQDCPHCHNYMDVPDPDENWDDVDFGSEEDDEQPPDQKPEA